MSGTGGDDFTGFWQDPEALKRRQEEAARLNGATVTLVRGVDLTPEPYQWLWVHWLAKGKLEILAGAVGTGKTTLAIGTAATITNGGAWPDGSHPQQADDVLMWSGEDSVTDTLLPRFIAAGGDREKIHFVANIIVKGKKRAFNPSIDMPALAEAAKSIPGLGLVLVDPIVMMVPGDSHKNAEVRRGLQPLVDLAVERNVAALGISHLTKGTAGRDPIERLTGSLAFGAGPRIVMMAAKPLDPEQPRRLVRVKSNIGPDGDGFEYALVQVLLDENSPDVYGQRLAWGNQLYGSAQELLNGIELPQDKWVPARTAATQFLFMLLENGPMPSQWIKSAAKEAGLSWRTVVRACEDLKINVSRIGKVGSEEQQWQWELPKDLNPGEETDL